MPPGFEQFRDLSDDAWIDMVTRSVTEPTIDSVHFAEFPCASLQEMICGNSNELAIRGAGSFYKLVKSHYLQLTGTPLDSATILDFGIGWGRIARLFAREAGLGRLHGVDPLAQMVEVCRETRVPAAVARTKSDGLLPYRDALFDLVYAFSVFTHLPQPLSQHWLDEICRVLKPGGMVVLTVEPPRFLAFCRSIPAGPVASDWHRELRDAVAAMPEAEAFAAAGQFVYLPTGGGPELPTHVYGDAVIPRAFVERAWSTKFKLLDYLDDPQQFRQAVVVMVKL